jgi:predicted PurR-regulated permease PerM
MSTVSRPSGDVTHTTLSVLFLALLVAATFWVLSPFMTSLLWATVITVATWPLFLKFERILGNRRGLALTITTVAILLVVFVPVTLAVSTIVTNARSISVDLTSLESISIPAAPAWLARVPIAGARVAAKWDAFAALTPTDRVTVLTPYVQTALQWFVSKAGSVGTMLLQFLLTAIIAAILFAKGEIARDGILRFADRLAGRQGRDVAILAAQTIRGVVLGVVGTALIQTAIGGLGLFISGVPAAALLTAVMLFFCLAQIGPILVVGPAVAWLYWSGSSGRGTTMLVFAIVAVALDNVIRPILIRRGANLPLVLIFGGVIGGLLAFGIIGLFVGPVVLTVAYTMLRAWVNEPRERVH